VRLKKLGGLTYQLLDERDALAALRLFSEGAIDHRDGARLILGVGAELAIGDSVAETNVHSRPGPKLISFI
jgi:hypothetical protein